eukprot:scaffold19932_cov64-Attheya_sp.AAC.1
MPPKSLGPKRIFRGKLLMYPSLDSSRGNSSWCRASNWAKSIAVDASGYEILGRYIVIIFRGILKASCFSHSEHLDLFCFGDPFDLSHSPPS